MAQSAAGKKTEPAPSKKAGRTLDQQVETCNTCHGDAGRQKLPQIPAIAGQPKLFLMYQLFFFREGRRSDPIMNGLAKDLSDADLDALAERLSRERPVLAPPTTVDRTRFERGANLATRLRCESCHNPDYSGREQMPRLLGQQETYLVKALGDYRTGARVGTQAAMAEVLRDLTDADFADLAHFLANFRP